MARALRLLDELLESEEGVGVNELGRRIGVNASTASRLLSKRERNMASLLTSASSAHLRSVMSMTVPNRLR